MTKPPCVVQILPRILTYPLPWRVDWMPWDQTLCGNALMNPLMAEGGSGYMDDGCPKPGAFDETLLNLGTLYYQF